MRWIALATVVLSITTSQAQVAEEPSSLFSVPSGPLPWPLPTWPTPVINLGPGSATLNPITHTSNYAVMVADTNARIASITTPINSASNQLNQFLGPGGSLPDMTGSGDWETGLAPGGNSLSAYEAANTFGQNVGLSFSYARSLTTIDIGESAYFFGFILLCIAWMLFVIFVKFALQLTDMLFNVATKLIELIPFAE